MCVVIATYKRTPDILKRCMESLSKGVHCILIMQIDNNQDYSFLKEYNHDIIRTSIGGTGVKGLGMDFYMKYCSTPKICMIDDDAILKPHCLERLSIVLNDPKIGVAGPAGPYIQWYRKATFPMDIRCVGICWATRRDVISEIGSIDPQIVYPEDRDFQTRVQISGKRVVIDNQCDVIHKAGQEGGAKAFAEKFHNSSHIGLRKVTVEAMNKKYPNLFSLNSRGSYMLNKKQLELYKKYYQEGKIKLDTTLGIIFTDRGKIDD